MKLLKVLPLFVLAIPALGSPILFTKSLLNAGYNYAGSAEFTEVIESGNNKLKIVFTNTSPDAVPNNPQVLTGLFWDMVGDPAAVKDRAEITAGSSLVNGTIAANQIGTEWGYNGDVDTLAQNPWGGAKYGVGASGLSGPNGLAGAFGSGSRFIPASGGLGNPDYGLVPVAGGTGNGGNNDWVRSSMTFFIDLPTGYAFNNSSISNVWFQYGSQRNGDEYYYNVPEPGTLVALGVGALALLKRKRRKV